MFVPRLSKLVTTSAPFTIGRAMSTSPNSSRYVFETLSVSSPDEHVLHVEINRPQKLNAMSNTFWREMAECFRGIKDDRQCRSVIISGAGRMFTAGMDLANFQDMASKIGSDMDVARKAKYIQPLVAQYQESFSSIEKCSKPVIAAIHSGCIGGGMSLISACDIRYCTEDAYFSLKEVDLGMAADVGALQRLPRIIGNGSTLRELAYTADNYNAQEAKEMGLVGRIFPNKEEMMKATFALAKKIASKSPVAVQGSKIAINFSRDHTIQEGLDFMTYWNMTMLQSEDVLKAAGALIMKDEPPKFSKL